MWEDLDGVVTRLFRLIKYGILHLNLTTSDGAEDAPTGEPSFFFLA